MPDRIVVDTSIVLACAKGEASQAQIRQQIGGADWIAPTSLHFEVGNAISRDLKGVKGRTRITLEAAHAILARYARERVGFIDPNMPMAIEIAGRYGIYAYDAYVLSLALEEGAPVATGDKGMARVAEDMGIPVLFFTAE